MEGDVVEYKSIGKIIQTIEAVNYSVKYLNSLNPPEFLSYILRLKIRRPVILLRNLNPQKMCNGTKLEVTAFKNIFIEATIFIGCTRGESAIISRILIISLDYPFEFKKLQFPLRLCFAMT